MSHKQYEHHCARCGKARKLMHVVGDYILCAVCLVKIVSAAMTGKERGE